jgi:D-glutamate cyclase
MESAMRARFESIDRLVTVEMRPSGTPTMGIARKLYDAASKGEPISLQAAQALLECEGGRVALITGAAISLRWPKGEIDGPIGAAVLAHALGACGFQADVIVPTPMIDVLEGVRDVLGASFQVCDESRLTGTYDAAVSIEKLGRNRKGVRHGLVGTPSEPRPEEAFNPDDLIESLNARGLLTIGIGDGGNEIGFGAIFDEARQIVPTGSDCGCPCHDGVVTSTATRIVFPATVSNYGAYAITAALGLLTERPDMLPAAEVVADAMVAAVERGCFDGAIPDPTSIGDDGVPVDGVMAVVTLLRTIVAQSLRVMPAEAYGRLEPSIN